MTLNTIPARHGVALPLKAGQSIKVINTHGSQVIDTWAFTLSSFPPPSVPSPAYPVTITSQLSMQHTRASLNRTIPRVNDSLYNNQRSALLTLTADTSPGHHDTLIAACDRYRYMELNSPDQHHRNCADNLAEALSAVGVQPPLFTPSPLNLFMNIPVHTNTNTEAGEGGRGNTDLSFEKPTSRPGDFVVLRAEVDLVVAFSTCPQDILMINGGEPREAHFEVF